MTLNKTTIIENHKTKNSFTLTPLTQNLPNQDSLTQDIYTCCSEEVIYYWLFRKSHPKGYTLKDAQSFLDYANKGWKEKTHFIYAILSQDPIPKLVGAIDIKSTNLSSAEVGYWLSQNYSGIMTNALRQIILIAKQNDYQKLFAYVEHGNNLSEKVLKRTNFKYSHDKLEDSQLNHYYKLSLV